MQVNLSSALPNSASEGATAKSTEKAENSSAITFFAQIDQIMNKSVEPTSGQDEEKPEEPSSVAKGNSSLNLRISLSDVIPDAGADAKAKEENSQSAVTDLPINAGPNVLVPAVIVEAKDMGNVFKAEDPEKLSVFLIPNYPDSFTTAPSDVKVDATSQNTSPELALVRNPDNTGLFPQMRAEGQIPVNGGSYQAEAISMDALVSGCQFKQAIPQMRAEGQMPVNSGSYQAEAISMDMLVSGDQYKQSIPIVGNTSDKGISSPTLDEGISSPTLELSNNVENSQRNAQDTSGVVSDKSKLPLGMRSMSASTQSDESEIFNALVNESLIRNTTPENHQRTVVRNNSSDMFQNPEMGKNAQLFRDLNVQNDNGQSATSKKVENFVPINLENSKLDNSSLNQDRSGNESNHPAMSQSKLNSSPIDAVRFRVSAENPHPEIPVSFASNTRVIESNTPIASSAVPSGAPQTRNLIDQLAERIQIQVREGKGEIRIQLKPDNLGRMEIRAETTSSGVMARITTESGSVKSFLENNMHLLHQTLQDQGLKVDRIHVVVQDGFESSALSGHAKQFGHAGSNGHEKESGSSSKAMISAANPVDEITVDPTIWISANPDARFHRIA
jgi:flagellar hook-length control protein FliK